MWTRPDPSISCLFNIAVLGLIDISQVGGTFMHINRFARQGLVIFLTEELFDQLFLQLLYEYILTWGGQYTKIV